MAATFTEAGEVSTLADVLVEKRHQRLSGVEVVYYFRTGEWTAEGKDVLGKVKVASPLDKAMMGNDAAFIILVNEDRWRDLGKAPDGERLQRALVDELLCQCGGAADEGWRRKREDFSGYQENLAEFGAWRTELADACETFRQLPLPLRQPAAAKGAPANGRRKGKDAGTTAESGQEAAAAGP